MLIVAAPGGGHRPESAAASDFVAGLAAGPAGLMFEGEAGIGKTTAWAHTVQRAADAGVRVLSTRASAAEARMTFAALAELLDGVDPSLLGALAPVQRIALDRVLLRGDAGPPTDERVASAAFLSLLELLSAQSPVLVAIDDVQWLDSSSKTAVAFAARRLKGPIGVLVTARTGEPDGTDTSWLQLPHHDGLTRVSLRPLSPGALHTVIADQLGRALPRPLIDKIHQISGGNPFFALELARTDEDTPALNRVELPGSLTAVVDRRLGTVTGEPARVLLAAACAGDPTAADLAQATDNTIEGVMDVLEDVESRAIITLDGNRVRFTHPLLAHGVYTHATAAARRTMHRRLAAITDQPELRARHLALASEGGPDEATLSALDAGAEAAAARGAHSSAAELINMAIRLGGDTPVRRLRGAELHFRAGDLTAADTRLGPINDTMPPGALRAIALMLRGAVYGYRDGGARAVDVLAAGVEEAGDNPALRLQGLLLLALAVGMTGDIARSVDYARQAAADAERLGVPALRSQALTLATHVSFMYGLGLDHAGLQSALELEDPDSTAPATLQARAVDAVLCAWTGRLDEARTKVAAVAQRCRDRGNEVDVVWAAEFLTMIDLWSGHWAEAARTADDATDRARQIGGHLLMITALICQAAVAAHTGRAEDTHDAARAAIDAAHDSGIGYLALAPTASLALLEVSRQDYSAALTVLEPVLATFDPVHSTEIMVGGYLPDAIEALIGVGRLDEAEPLISALETNGTRLDRPWMLAAGVRGRAQILTARGDLDAAEQRAHLALAHHERVSMPFEAARTQLVLGGVQRRRRRRQSATTTLRAALTAFETLGSPLWAERARAELERLQPISADSQVLTEAEQRVSVRAASGMSNREIAAELFISVKTVEMNLSSVFRKLRIRSRTELSARLNATEVT